MNNNDVLTYSHDQMCLYNQLYLGFSQDTTELRVDVQQHKL